jgi:hypothetical protein
LARVLVHHATRVDPFDEGVVMGITRSSPIETFSAHYKYDNWLGISE